MSYNDSRSIAQGHEQTATASRHTRYRLRTSTAPYYSIFVQVSKIESTSDNSITHPDVRLHFTYMVPHCSEWPRL